MRLIRLLKNDLAKETTSWVVEKIISTDQAELICSRYGIDYHNQNRHSYGYFSLVALGYLFIGLALITLLGANWEEIPRFIRMMGVITLTLAVNLIGIYQVKLGKNSAAIGCFFLGGLFYGAAIMLIAQIYHIGEHYPDGIFWWAIGVIPMAILMQSTLLMILAITLAFIWFFVESSLIFFPTMFPLFLFALAWHCFRIKQSNILFLSLIAGLGSWAEYYLSWALGDFQYFNSSVENISLGVAIFILFYGFSKWLMDKKNIMLGDYGTLLAAWVLRFAVLFLLIFSYEEPWEALLDAKWESPVLAISFAFILSTLSIWLTYSAQKQVLLITAISVLNIITLLILMYVKSENTSVTLQVLDNIILLMSGIWLIVRGIQHSISHYFFSGVLIILVMALLRYIDLVGDYIGTTILFSVFALVILSVANIWKSQQLLQGQANE